MSKWRVHCGKGSCRGNFYLHHPDRIPSGWTHFSSWEEAIAEANERARTVEVKLPGIEPRYEIRNDDTVLTITSIGQAVILDRCVLNPDELKPVGEYLLALHHHHERT